MLENGIPVDVLCVCSADGEIRPLRLRMGLAGQLSERVDIDEILDTMQVQHTGAEAKIYRCRAVVENQVWMFDLKYFVRGHRWCLYRRVY